MHITINPDSKHITSINNTINPEVLDGVYDVGSGTINNVVVSCGITGGCVGTSIVDAVDAVAVDVVVVNA
jgi:hypothetical protein